MKFNLRGYGDSDRPASHANSGHTPYSKREMARDMVALMAQLGFARFKVLAHDRAARVAHRMLADQPLQVLWGQNGVIASCFDPLKDWRRVAVTVAGQPLPCGHYVAKEAPVALLEATLPFLLKP